eukprot:211095-Hanusia_phi.AAC.1
MASIGQVTGTQVHSGPKHIIQCQVSEDVLRALAVDDDARDRIQREKMLHCMHKHELALNCSIPYNTENNVLFRIRRSAYPPVVTTLGIIGQETKKMLAAVYCAKTDEEFEDIRDGITSLQKDITKKMAIFPSFSFQGVVQTQAWATDNYGDTVGSILVAGFATIMNGHFHAYTGDLVHWYFDFESRMFNEDTGTRKVIDSSKHADYIAALDAVWDGKDIALGDKAGKRREDHERREYGKYPDLFKDYVMKGANRNYKQNVVYPKTYHYDDSGYGDRIRVFGRVVNGGRPFEPIDVLIFSQCR